MLGPAYIALGRDNGGRRRAPFELCLRLQQGKIEFGHVELAHRMARPAGALGVGVGQRMAQALAVRIGMAVDDEDVADRRRHGQNHDTGVLGLP